MKFHFSDAPDSGDFVTLADHLSKAGRNDVHPALFPRSEKVADALREMSAVPVSEENRTRYHALRLFVW